jgi:predicted HTH domain antitoxin
MSRFDQPKFPLAIQAVLDEIAENLDARGDAKLASKVDATTETLAGPAEDEEEAEHLNDLATELGNMCTEQLVKILSRESIKHQPYQLRDLKELVNTYFLDRFAKH